MASITINFPDDQQQRIRDALCAYGGWTEDQGARSEFARQQVRKLIRDVVRHVERTAAIASAEAIPEPDLT
jgi:hypothetical protein